MTINQIRRNPLAFTPETASVENDRWKEQFLREQELAAFMRGRAFAAEEHVERLNAVIAEALQVMDRGHYGDPEVPFRMREHLERTAAAAERND